MKTNPGFLMAVLLTGCTTTVIDMPKGDGGGTADTGTQPDGAVPDGGVADTGVTCSNKNCAGCCYNGACQAGTSAGACGYLGAMCEVCPTHTICTAGQNCGVDPEGTWKVQPLSATIAFTNQGSDWDFGGGAPDPFVTLWCPSSSVSATSSTLTAMDTFFPTWSTGGCVMKAKDLLGVGYAIQPWDEDISSNDPISGKGTIVPKESDLLAGGMNLSGLPNLITMNVGLVKQ